MTTAAASRPNLLALRSVTKIYAMHGIRVGYAVASADMVDRIRALPESLERGLAVRGRIAGGAGR